MIEIPSFYVMALLFAVGMVIGSLITLHLLERVRTAKSHPEREQAVEKGPNHPFPIDLKQGCPDCGGDRFLEGPSGGMCVNLKCANCGSKFNFAPSLGAHRI